MFSVPGASFLDSRHYGCVSHWLTELTLSQNFANPLCLFTRRCRAPGCDGFLILRKFFQNPPCLFTRRCRPGGRPGGRAAIFRTSSTNRSEIFREKCLGRNFYGEIFSGNQAVRKLGLLTTISPSLSPSVGILSK